MLEHDYPPIPFPLATQILFVNFAGAKYNREFNQASGKLWPTLLKSAG